MIDYSKWPPYFVADSIEREIFQPESDTHASVSQVRALIADAKFYTDAWGPDQCPRGLKQSARAVLRHATAALESEHGTGAR